MFHKYGRRTAATVFLLVTIAMTGCSDDGSAPEKSDVRSTTSATSAAASSVAAASSPTAAASPLSSSTPSPPPASTPPPASPPFVASATWDDSDHGLTLRISPTPSARQAGGPDDSATAWAEVLRLAPDADSPGMWGQFSCHWTWARIIEPDKPTWNIEPWRPVVPIESMLSAGCNPGGPEV
jgi:hypothetical protein